MTLQVVENTACESGGIGRRTRLRIWRGNSWGFKSPLSHHSWLVSICYTLSNMNPSHPQPKIHIQKSHDYRENYANSVQVRVSVWDFFLAFGLVHQDTADQVTIENSQGIYISPQQAKALLNVLSQNISQYEQTFGEIALEPQTHPLPMPHGPVH
jgi:Protein of unknown function (DUF3467)